MLWRGGDFSLIVLTGTPPAIDDGLSIQGFIANPVNLGADTALTPNLDVINAPIAFTPDDTNIAATLPDLTVPPVQIASADGNIGTGNSAISLQQFKDDVNKYANDPKLTTAERQTLKDYGDVAAKLTPEDFGKLTLDYNFATPGKDANGNTVSVDTVGDLTPRAQTAVRQANFPNAYRTNNGFNFGSIATQGTSTLLNALIRLGTAFGERQILNPQSQIYTVVQKIGVPVSVAVPVTFRVGVAVPTTVLSTLPGGVVTKILVYRPNPPKTTATSILSSATAKPVVSPAKPTITPVPAKPVTRNPAKVKREAQDSANAEPPKEAQGQEHYVSPPPEQSDPEYYVEPEPKEWETTYGKEVVINPVEASGHEKEAEKPQWDKIDSTFQYQAGDYSWEYPHPPPGKSDEAAYPKDEAVAPKEEAAYPNGSGGGSVEEEKPIPWMLTGCVGMVANGRFPCWADLRVYLHLFRVFPSGQYPFRFVLLAMICTYLIVLLLSRIDVKRVFQSSILMPAFS